MAILKWEKLETIGGPEFCYRANVPGGWLVAFERSDTSDDNHGYSWGYGMGGMTFLPDPSHEWDGGNGNGSTPFGGGGGRW